MTGRLTFHRLQPRWHHRGQRKTVARIGFLFLPGFAHTVGFIGAFGIASVNLHADLQEVDKGMIGFQHFFDKEKVNLDAPI